MLIGQPELAEKLSERNMEVREVVQRCEVVELLPLDNSLEDFLVFKLQRAGKQLADVMDSSAVEAIHARLSNLGSNRKSMVSLLYPLAVSNTVVRRLIWPLKSGFRRLMRTLSGALTMKIIADINQQMHQLQSAITSLNAMNTTVQSVMIAGGKPVIRIAKMVTVSG